MNTAAPTINNVFLVLLPPSSTLPPKVKEDGGADAPSIEAVFSSALSCRSATTFPVALAGSKIAAEGLSSVEILCSGSRAGAGALPAPDPNPPELACESPALGRGEGISAWLTAVFVSIFVVSIFAVSILAVPTFAPGLATGGKATS
jgi:hypothetical protein